jgi:hypothetical protein
MWNVRIWADSCGEVDLGYGQETSQTRGTDGGTPIALTHFRKRKCLWRGGVGTTIGSGRIARWVIGRWRRRCASHKRPASVPSLVSGRWRRFTR